MKIEDSIIPYLKGEKFSNGLIIKIAHKQKVIDRIKYLCNYAKNKSIIHVGCVDHIPLIKGKIKNNTWLHKRLDEVVKRQFGIDLNEEGIQYMKEELNLTDVAVENILDGSINPVILNNQWDSIILGEILEHVDNPVLFLSKVRERYKSCINEIVVTVPNAMSIKNTAFSFLNKEQINSDHYYWFSPYTLARILLKAGFTPLYHDFVTYYPLNNGTNKIKKFFLRFLLTRNPSFRAGLIYVAKF